jgi:hypothetical protein
LVLGVESRVVAKDGKGESLMSLNY